MLVAVVPAATTDTENAVETSGRWLSVTATVRIPPEVFSATDSAVAAVAAAFDPNAILASSASSSVIVNIAVLAALLRL